MLDPADPLLPLPLQSSSCSSNEKKEGKESAAIGIKEENGGAAGGAAEEGGVVKANKGMILRKSVEYIRWVLHFLKFI